MKDIIGTIENLGKFNKFLKLIELTGHTDTLRDSSKFTILAPTDEAMTELENEYPMRREYRDYFLTILKKHVIRGKCNYSCLVKGEKNESMYGDEIKVDPKSNRINERIRLLAEDIRCKNGMVHVIDGALMH